AGEVASHDGSAQRRYVPVAQESRLAARIEIERWAIFAGEMAIVRGGGKPVAGEADRLRKEVGPGQPAKDAMHRAEPGYHTRHRDRKRPGARNAAGITLRGCQRGG